jgi:hypothetical protein
VIFAQTNKLKGKIINDSNNPVSFATITLRTTKDSAVVKYTSSDEAGKYQINGIQNGQYSVEARCIGYSAESTNVWFFGNNDLETDFILKEEAEKINEAKITANYKGFEIIGDTIRYDPRAYTDGSEITLGDMMNKLPGIEVDKSGRIKAQGKNVETVLIEGRDLFSGNTQIATQNLPANIADKVEVVTNYSEYSILRGFQSHEKTAVNVKVNDSFLGKITGNLSVSGGVKDKYSTKNNIISLFPKIMSSVTLSANNTGESLLDFMDYLKMKGGLNEFINNTDVFSFEFDETETALLQPDISNVYSNTNALTSVNLSSQPNKKIKINSYGLLNLSKLRADKEKRYTFFDTNENYFNFEKTKKYNIIGSVFLKLAYDFSEKTNYSYQGKFDDTFVKFNTDVKNIDFYVFDKNSKKSLNTSHAFTMLKKINENVLTANASFSYKMSPAYYDFRTDSLLLPIPFTETGNMFYGLQESATKNVNTTLDFSYLHRFNEQYFMRITLGAGYMYNVFTSCIYDKIPNSNKKLLADDNLSNNIFFNRFDQSLNLKFIKNKGVFGFKIGGALRNITSKDNVNILADNNKIIFEPQIEFSFVPKHSQRLTISYSKNISSLSAGNLISSIYLNDYSNYMYGNNVTDLYYVKHRISSLLIIVNQFRNLQLITNISYETNKNTTTKDYFRAGLTNEVKTVTSPEKQTFFAMSSFSKKFLFAPINFRIEINYQQNKYLYFINSNKIKYRSYSPSANIGIESGYKQGFNGSVYANFSQSYYKTTVSNKQDIQRYTGKISFAKNRFYISTSVGYENNNAGKITQNFYYWDANVRYKFNEKYGIELTGSDMLHLSNKRWREISHIENVIVENYLYRIPGYIMLKFNMKI